MTAPTATSSALGEGLRERLIAFMRDYDTSTHGTIDRECIADAFLADPIKPTLDALATLTAERDALVKENDHLRASLANSGGPCAYCNLPREDWAKCASGFPGCGRADDAMLCPHVGAELETAEALAASRAAETAAIRGRDEARAGWSEAQANGETYRDQAITTGIALAAANARAERLAEALKAATANLTGAASAYRKHAARHLSVGRAVADPFFTTRAADFERAADAARASLEVPQ